MTRVFPTPAAKLANTIAICEQEHPTIDWRPWYEIGLASWMALMARYRFLCNTASDDQPTLAEYVLAVLEAEAEPFGWFGWVYADTVLMRIWESTGRDLRAESDALRAQVQHETIN